MKTAALFFFALLPSAWAATTAGSAAPAAPADATSAPVFAAITPDYKKPQELPDSFFNPFKIQAVSDAALSGHEVVAVSNDVVLTALSHRGLSGLLYGDTAALNRVIIGDQIFEVGDELTFANDKDEVAPLVTGATVVLRAVRANSLLFEVTPTGETARQLTYPLKAFWRP